jgi:hypothetical protein
VYGVAYWPPPCLPDEPDEEQAKTALEHVQVTASDLHGISSMILMNDINNLLQDRQPHDDLAPWAAH